MKKIFPFLALALLALATACSSEDTPEVDYNNPTAYFVPADDDLSFTAQLRRQFYQDNGSYLLFNDTLQHQFLGKDINGDDRYFTETLDMTYDIGQSSPSSYEYTYTYLTDDSTRLAMTQFVEQYILTHMTGKMRPYSFFLCRSISGKSIYSSGSATLRPYALSNERCTAVSTNYLLQRQRTDAQKTAYAQRIINIMLSQMVVNNSSAFADFFAYNADDYGVNYPEGFTNTTENMRQRGFLTSNAGYFPTRTQDLTAYTAEAVASSDAQLQTKYGNYPIVLAKFAIVRRVLVELGYKF